MLSSWAAWALTVGIAAVLGIGLYLLAWHRGYLAGLDACGFRPFRRREPEPWTPPSEAEFLAELIEAERLKPEPPRKYQREP